MNLLTSALYDPSTAVTNKATSSLLAMTAFDTTNLRLSVTVPAHGKVLFRLQCTVTGATTVPAVLLGVLTGATVVGRVSPREIGVASATTSLVQFFAEFTATGLTPGAANFDAAYAVQVVVASTNIKYGGPNNNSGANAWGGFLFEAWDPQPLPAAGIAGTTFPTTLASTTNITAGTITTVTTVTNQLTAAQIATGIWQDTTAGDFTTALSVGKSVMNGVALGTGLTVANLTNAPTSGDLTATMKTSVTTAATAATPTIAAASTITSVSGAVGSVTGNVGGNVTGSVGSVVGAVGSVTGNVGGNVVGSVASVTARVTANTDQLNAKNVTAAGLSVAFPSGTLASTTNITTALATMDHIIASSSAGAFSAVNFRAIVDQLTRGQIVSGSGSTTTSLISTFLGNVASSTALTIGAADQLKGRRITFAVDASTSGLAGFTTVITASTNATPPVLTVSPALPVAPTGAVDTFSLDSALADIAEIAGNATSATNLSGNTLDTTTGVVGVGSTTTSIVTSSMTPPGSIANQFGSNIQPRYLIFDVGTTTAALRNQSTTVSASTNAAAPVLTVNPLTTAPAAGDTFRIL